MLDLEFSLRAPLTMSIEGETLLYFIHHVFLPPRLPDRDDHEITKDTAILNFTITCVEGFLESTSHPAIWRDIMKMLSNLWFLEGTRAQGTSALDPNTIQRQLEGMQTKGTLSRGTSSLDTSAIQRQLEEIQPEGTRTQGTNALDPSMIQRQLEEIRPREALVFRIQSQNACVIVRKQEGTTIYESFEIDPPNKVIMGTVGRIISSFPGPSISVPDDTVTQASFQTEFASFLAKMDIDILDSTAAIVKVDTGVEEVRDTADPHYITQLLTAILRGLPGSYATDVPRIDKRIRNDIIWNGGHKPWRRSPLWLVTRVSIQTTLYQLLGVSAGRNEYKTFMAFLMAEALLLDGCAGVSTDLICCMQAKAARRLAKLSEVPKTVVNKVTTAVETTKSIIMARWSDLQIDQGKSSSWTPDDLDIQADTQISLPKSRGYIHQRLQPSPIRNIQPPFEPSEFPRLIMALQDGTAFSSQLLSAALSKDPYIALADIEDFVENSFDGWVTRNSHNASACRTVAECIEVYARAANPRYENNPEDESRKILTVLQLWVGLDRLAVSQIPLLAEYTPEIPRTLLEPLLIRRSSSIQRFVGIQDYLCGRHTCASRGSVFTDAVTSTSFSIQYFDSSPELNALKRRIEMRAQQERDAKKEELRRKQVEYQTRRAEAASMEHEYHWQYTYHCDYRCARCRREREARQMKIAIHEWPLPQDDLEAKSTVFELQCPAIFQSWRSTTYSVLYDMCRPKLDRPSAQNEGHLRDYPGLRNYCGSVSRVSYASRTKPFSTLHYSEINVEGAEITKLFVNNGLAFRLFDGPAQRWVSGSFQDCEIVALCTFELPRGGLYHSLQYAVDGTFHSPNKPIAEQAAVPPQLSIHEHTAFGTLRSGPRLQWLNIIRELRARTLSFARQEVQLLLIQSAFQIGPINLDHDPEWHEFLKCPKFGVTLLDEIDDLITNIQDNWLHLISLQTVILLVTRLLTSNKTDHIVEKAVKILRRARAVAFQWMSQVSENFQDAENIDDTQQRLCAIAATCRSTYDVDSCHCDYLLRSDEDISILVQCLIQVHDNTPPGTLPHELRHLLARDTRLSRSLIPSVVSRLDQSRTGLDMAVSATWSAYRCGSPWTQLLCPNDRWVTTTTSTTSTSASSTVHLNLLDGTLLIDGKPLGRLPSTIVTHVTYLRLLSNKILDVVPSELLNMDFATRNEIHKFGPHLHFKLRGTDLVIQATRGSEIYELIPHKRFADDLPVPFVENYAHWLQLSPRLSSTHSQIEFRPLVSRWDTSGDNWRMIFSLAGIKMRHGVSDARMLDIHSPTYAMVSRRLKPLEIPEYLHITSTGRHNLSIDLPRYKLSFFLNTNEEIESNNMRDMVVDSDQFSGTMVGLSSQLVLRSAKPLGAKLPRSRCVIIPITKEVDAHSKGYHIKLNARLGNQDSIQYFKYDIDTDLGCLVGHTLLGDLYKIFLHASTSYPLPDPLTGRTGIEEALNELASARCSSFQKLSADERKVLDRIAQLVPTRKWYPDHLRVMQTVTWRPIGSSAQHWGLCLRVRSILEFHAKLAIFDNKPTSHDIPDDHLHNRAASRNFYIFSPECGAASATARYDQNYPTLDNARSKCPPEEDITLAADVSAMVQRWQDRSHVISDLWGVLKGWGTLTNQKSPHFSLSYNSDFLRPTLSQLWIPIYDKIRKGDKLDTQAKLTFTLPAMMYGSKENVRYLPTILAFATLRDFSTIDRPQWDKYDLSIGVAPTLNTILNIIRRHTLPLDQCPPDHLVCNASETRDQFWRRRESHRIATYETQARTMAEMLIAHWPHEQPPIPCDSRFTVIDVRSARLKNEMDEYFFNCFRNMHFYSYVKEVQQVLDLAHMHSNTTVSSFCLPYTPFVPPVVARPRHSAISFCDLLLRRAPPPMPAPPAVLRHPFKNCLLTDSSNSALQPLVDNFAQSGDAVRFEYGRALDQSLKSYNLPSRTSFSLNKIPFSHEMLSIHLALCNDHVTELFAAIAKALSPENPIEKVQSASHKWPRITTRTLLGLLSATSHIQLTSGWKSALVLFAQGLMRLQRAQRLLHCGLSNNVEDFIKELENDEFETDIAFNKYPEWLLIQIEGNFMARPIQSRVAEEMMFPQGNENSLLQLNMGEGKSSVIVPLIASCLADGETIVRVVVLKPLVNQMFTLLSRRLGGLANRRIFYLPFSRDVKATMESTRVLQSLFELCMCNRGILIVQPEHILSFKLMGINLVIDSGGAQTAGVADALLASQRWLTNKSRDILDESDEILSVNYQLVYTSGRQGPLEDHPDRWLRIQEILSSTKKHARRLAAKYPTGLEVDKTTKSSQFPLIRILDVVAGQDLINSVAQDLLAHPRFRLLPADIRPAVLHFISEGTPDANITALLEAHCSSPSLWKCLLLFRGIIGCGILRFILQEKRWRVDYGLDLSRTLFAVPYRAKDVPNFRADYGHPDVAIGLTCLSYYYGGLTDREMDVCFQLLFKLDNPALEYEAWIRDDDEVPESLQRIIGVNPEDLVQRKRLINLFRRNHAVINFYLSSIVFPKEAKQYPHKLASSAWDLAEAKAHVTTGFSGTNDNQYLLPTSIQQRDPLDQGSTNARVLTYLLRPENSRYVCLQRDGDSLTSYDFLKHMISETPPVRVLLDVGAQMLDMQSSQIAATWLALAPNLHAIVFFDNDQLIVMSRDGSTESFSSSQYNQKLDLCGIYLDDEHTRGTDLKLPQDFRAAVTLGPKLNKDRLMQGCMRMRKLGHGQSVMFFAPPDVDRVIRDVAHVAPNVAVTVLDILRWAMTETCDYITHHLSHWAQQGVDHTRRSIAWTAYAAAPSDTGAIDALRGAWEEPDARSLSDMYFPKPSAIPALQSSQDFKTATDTKLVCDINELDRKPVTPCNTEKPSMHPAFAAPLLAARLARLGVYTLSSTHMDEEQEREVAHEQESERITERPPPAQPAPHCAVHPDVRALVTHGTMIPAGSCALVPLFAPLQRFGAHTWSDALWATRDFATTVIGEIDDAAEYQRPVTWVLSVQGIGVQMLVVVSPFEAEALLPDIQRSTAVRLHMYTARVTEGMRTLEDLTFFCVPALPPAPAWTPPAAMDIAQLNLWAGQLYLRNYAAYEELCLVLGLIGDDARGETQWEDDGFVREENRRGKMARVCRLETSALPFLREVVGLRRKGMKYTATHMGKILGGGVLTRADFEA